MPDNQPSYSTPQARQKPKILGYTTGRSSRVVRFTMVTYVLGINDGHTATACLVGDGHIIACASEERFTRTKNQAGFPEKASMFCLSVAGIKPNGLARVVIATQRMAYHPEVRYQGYEKKTLAALEKTGVAISRLKSLRPLLEHGYEWLSPRLGAKSQKVRINRAVVALGIEHEKVFLVDHHTAHAYAAIYCSPFPSQQKDALVLTNDGYGDSVCASVHEYRDGRMRCVSTTYYTNSLGSFYQYVTEYMGMKPLQDEYKIMGLAGYVENDHSQLAFDRIRRFFDVKDDLAFKSIIPIYAYGRFIKQAFLKLRFDQVAAAVQRVTEEVMVQWVRKAVQKTRLQHVAASGGTFLNVKANMLIAKLEDVKHIFVMPSPGDESNAIGAAYWGYLGLHPKERIEPITHLYWGPKYEESGIRDLLESVASRRWTFTHLSDVDKEVADIIARGGIVARFKGRMEFGARALGNRSILADASRASCVRALNKSVKSRDFWMPFAPTIMRGYESRYISGPEPTKTNDQYMIFAYESTDAARTDLLAAMHPYDYTLRPQALDHGWNTDYFKLIENFQSKTGRACLLNTSFNLHGEPIVCTPADALHVFEKSGLKHLAIENYLLSKLDPP